MRQILQRLAILIGFIGIAWLGRAWLTDPDFADLYDPGIVAPDEPVQAKTALQAFEHGRFKITPLASIKIEALVLRAKRYTKDRGSALSPLDLALGWGPMSDPAVLDAIRINQRERFYYWRTKDFPIPRSQIERCSANMHLIPADDAVRSAMLKTRRGDVVQIEGQLVAVRADDGWRWRSSTSRGDIGNGACELIWVERFRRTPPPR
jgi:hypothetical protein